MRKKLICLIIVFSLIVALPSYCFAKNHSKAFESYAENSIKGSLANEINILLINELNLNNNDNYIEILRKNDGVIDYISVDTRKINLFANKMSQKIYECVSEHENDFKIPLGDTLGIKLLSAKGPKMAFDVTHLGVVSYNVKSELLSSGINQTLHRVSIVFETQIECTAPFYEMSSMIQNEIIISEILLVGNIPQINVSSDG